MSLAWGGFNFNKHMEIFIKVCIFCITRTSQLFLLYWILSLLFNPSLCFLVLNVSHKLICTIKIYNVNVLYLNQMVTVICIVWLSTVREVIINPFTLSISLVIHLTACHTILNYQSPNCCFSLFSLPVYLILYLYYREKCFLDHSCEQQG